MILLEGPSDLDLFAVGRILRDQYGYSLRRHDPHPLGWQRLTARLAEGHCKIAYIRSHLSDVVDAHLAHRPLEPEERWGLRTLELALHALAAQVLVLGGEATATNGPLLWQAHSPLRVQRAYAEGWESLPWQTTLPTRPVTREQLLINDRATRTFDRFLSGQTESESRAMRFLPPSLGIGNTHPAFLVIGEGPAPSLCRATPDGDLPDLPFSRGPASELLWRAVEELNLRWWEGYWLNASTLYSRGGWQMANVPIPKSLRILCLGAHAEDLIVQWAGEHAEGLAASGRWKVVEHPSHVMRFKHHEYASWRDEIGLFLASSLSAPGDLLARGPGTDPSLEGDL